MTNYVADLLEEKYLKYNQPNFIPNDPISIPHLFTRKEDIEIMGFWSAVLAWGQRKTIINKCKELITLMDGSPHDFIINHQDADLKPFLSFKHRTFNDIDTLYFIAWFRHYYQKYESLEEGFLVEYTSSEHTNVKQNLMSFHELFFSLENYPERTRKHIATPLKNSSCKRLNMFLRWMVRKDSHGVDFGIWHRLDTSTLICPCDVHVERVARKLGLVERPKPDWQMAVELTENLKLLDAKDPVKYDFALFGLGVEGEM
ncbi:TIGR02757 family protein [Arcicella aquatica]|uniref:TIGR02757 family protein n=1 Tax=Arcicella aquatica TaxID=217141 RepID=A0ABU5QIF0_9BACT|nr:TIGR02757 family protein [Arcicella aquatica]MEA5256822.1 TIGR02757 family protein [Arcicella aquatica]